MEQVQIDLGNLYPAQKDIRDVLSRDQVKRIAFIGSVQVGKSWLGARLLLEQVFTNTNPDSNLLVCISPSYKMIRVMIREFDKLLMQDKRLWKSVRKRKSPPVTYIFPNGKEIEFHSAEDPDTLRGLRPAFILVDEGSYISEAAYDVIEGRTVQTGAPIVITTTPRGKRHWLYRRLFVHGAPPSSPHHNPELYDPGRYYIRVATIFDNPYIKESERNAAIKAYGGLNSPWARQELLGDFVDYEGLVLSNFNEATMVLTPDKLPRISDFEYVAAGVDFGFTAPSFAGVIGLYRGVWYAIDEFYEKNVEIDDFGAQMGLQKTMWKVKRFWADSADPGRIKHYTRSALPMYPVVKPKIVQRLQYLNSLFAQGRFFIASACPNLIREIATLTWAQDKSEVPVGDDHAIDGITYALWAERGMLASQQPQFTDHDDWGPGFNKSWKPKAETSTMTAGYFQ